MRITDYIQRIKTPPDFRNTFAYHRHIPATRPVYGRPPSLHSGILNAMKYLEMEYRMKAFECRTCGECCFGEGGIFVGKKERQRISDFLGITVDEFSTRFCEERNGRLYIRVGEDGFCIYYDRGKSCLIHPVKPGRCALWPFFPAIVNDRENWEQAKEACPGINPDCPYEEFVRQAHKNRKP